MVCGVRLAIATAVTPEVTPAPVTANPEEWLELHNRGETPVDLTGWRIVDAVGFAFTPGTLIEPGASLVVARDAAEFRALHPDTRAVRGFRAARKRFYRQMLCAHAARQAAGDSPTG